MNTDKIIHSDLTESIIGAAMKVLNTLNVPVFFNHRGRESTEIGRHGIDLCGLRVSVVKFSA
jgi:hypothetical protein